MSVINQMLRDLDQRQKGAEAQPQASPAVVAPQRSVGIWLLLSLLVGGLLLWWWLASITEHSLSDRSASSETSQSVELVKPVAALTTVEMDTAISVLDAEALLPSGATELEHPESVVSVQMEASAAEAVTTASLNSEPASTEPESTEPAKAAESAASQKQTPPTEPVAQLSVERVELSEAAQQQQLRQQAIRAQNAGQWQEARRHWQQLQLVAPQQPEAYLALARMAQQSGHEAGVQYWLQLGLEQGASQQALIPELAASFARQQLWPQVLQSLAVLSASELQRSELALRAAAWQQLGEHPAALAAFEQLAAAEPEQGRWWLGMAISSDALGRRPQALAQFQRSLQLADDLTPASRDYIRQRLQELN
ncbi:hypothetical protein Q3O59_08280 [Alkalimonas delamerensis]|uniref:MSHA biogenesis protein MshN n=1 Tax=Alkalimonas delamerensis TaxID=265981 RepID=A0ABT9GPX4_9GAMM|nr:hypothetical protein [Alkalimonas delamerensis]MDP4529025.1 hypothetical protein [Alkalimonas delamerensis]